jgi:hypothetical protein
MPVLIFGDGFMPMEILGLLEIKDKALKAFLIPELE